MRYRLGKLLVVIGMRILPPGVRRMVINMILYNVPGALTDEQKAEVRAAAAEFRATRT